MEAHVDPERIARARNGDASAFEALVELLAALTA